MNELKFVCPSCGQHVECDTIHAGENFPCPACAALVRVPGEAAFTEAPAPAASPTGAPLAEELGKIFYMGREPVGDGSGHESPDTIKDSVSQSVVNGGNSAALHATQQAGGQCDCCSGAPARHGHWRQHLAGGRCDSGPKGGGRATNCSRRSTRPCRHAAAKGRNREATGGSAVNAR